VTGVHECLRDFSARVKSLSVFEPIWQLKGLRKYQEYDLVSLGLAVLLYILDSMLMGRSECDHEGISKFLLEVMRCHYNKELSSEEAEQLTYTVLDQLRNNGKPFEHPFKDLETGGSEKLRFHLIEIAGYQIGGKIKFKLSQEGLDLLFKTREIYQELRVTIAQIYLRQQIERRVFDGALQAVDDLYLQVKKVYSSLQDMRRAILRDVHAVSIDRYKQLVGRVQRQFQDEKKVFSELKELVRATEQDIRSHYLREKDRLALTQLLEVARRLDIVVNEHTRLFSEKLDLSMVLEETMESHIAHAFRTKISFDRELVDGVISNNASLETMRHLIHPILKPKPSKYFDMQKVFEPNLITRTVEEQEEEVVSDYDPEEVMEQLKREKALKELRDKRTRYYIEICLSPLEKSTSYTLLDVLQSMEPAACDDLINRVDFYPFLVQLHQTGTLPMEVTEEMESKTFDSTEGTNLLFLLLQYLKENEYLADKGVLEICGSEDVLTLANGCQVTNFVFRALSDVL
jgi:hypothetical protein